VLEEAQSDVLLLLDCCKAGTANTNEGNGITELISACGYSSIANGVGPYSFTHALVIELEALARRAEFSTGELYTNIYCRTQIRLPDDGAGTERHPPPIHLVLNNDSPYRRSIHLARRPGPGDGAKPCATPEVDDPSIDEIQTRNSSATHPTLAEGQYESSSSSEYEVRAVKEVPRLALAIRFNDDLRLEDLSTDLFIEWLRTIPVVAQQVRVEAGFDSFSSLLIVSIPISLFAYLPYNPAVTCLGPITSSNRVLPVQEHSFDTPAEGLSDSYISQDVMVAEQHSDVDEARICEESATSWPPTGPPADSPALGPTTGLSGMVRQHLRSDSNTHQSMVEYNPLALYLDSRPTTQSQCPRMKTPQGTIPWDSDDWDQAYDEGNKFSLDEKPDVKKTDSALPPETGRPPLGRGTSNTLSRSSSLSTITSVGSNDWPPDEDPPSPSPEIYTADSDLNEEESWEYPANLKDFRDRLQKARVDIFPSEEGVVYSRVSCLLLSWANEDANVPPKYEVPELAQLFRMAYNFDVDQYVIPSRGSHVAVMAKVQRFLEDEGPTHLKIVYYGGHGKVSSDGHSKWTR
jgi:hypothetical protein